MPPTTLPTKATRRPASAWRALDEFAQALEGDRGGTIHRKRRRSPSSPPRSATHRLPIEPFHALLSAFRQDVLVGRYATYHALLDYCRRSADPVGRLMLALYGARSPDNERDSDAICTGLQLTNFWQDVAIDWRKDRVYLPKEDLDRFGVGVAQIGEGRVDERWRALLAFETARTRKLLRSGRPLARRLPWRLGLEVSAVIAGGLRILDRIDAVGGDVFSHRPVLRRRDWWMVAFPGASSQR